MYHLNGSTVFSKLDLMWGFQQRELEEKSHEITTLVTRQHNKIIINRPFPTSFQSLFQCESTCEVYENQHLKSIRKM